ncbi:MAG: fumarylacetoacetate hydrolase family protein [Proteobacteria bacterium]|nr:fumarylacetoacetate hydrolase family protein [Pseudomonadota bacterium]
MGICVTRFQGSDEVVQWGIVENNLVTPLLTHYASHRELMDAFWDNPTSLQFNKETTLRLENLKLLSPITSDVQIFCQGLNYASHQAEGGVKTGKGQNLIFTKPASSICGPRDDIIRPAGCQLLDYEAELALVLKRDVPADTEVTNANLHHYVGGFTLANDVSARDLCFGAPMLQWFKGKGHRTFCPTGPILYVMDSEEIDLLSNLKLTLSVNGEPRQEATTDQLIFKPDETLTELASFTNVMKGDMLLTGTPGGVILKASPKVALAIIMYFTNDKKRREKLIKSQNGVRYLQPGDRLTLNLETKDGSRHFGNQMNTVRDATARGRGASAI